MRIQVSYVTSDALRDRCLIGERTTGIVAEFAFTNLQQYVNVYT